MVIPQSRPRAGRESVQNTVAREILVWFIDGNNPDDHTFQNQLAPGDMALSGEGNIWMWNGLIWALLVGSRSDDELRIKNVRIIDSNKGFEIEYEDGL